MRRFPPSRVISVPLVQTPTLNLQHGAQAPVRSIRALTNSPSLNLPRKSRPLSTSRKSTSKAKASRQDGHETLGPEAKESPGSGKPGPPSPLEDRVLSLIVPESSLEPVPPELEPLQHNVLAAFLPANQHTESLSAGSSSSGPSVPSFPHLPGVIPIGGPFHGPFPSPVPTPDTNAHQEAVITIVSPFEGGRHYNLDAVHQVAATVHAEILRLDLALGIGLNSPHAPLATNFGSPPDLASNPLFANPSNNQHEGGLPIQPLSHPETEEDEDEREPTDGTPVVVTSLSPRPLEMFRPGMSSNADARFGDGVKADWVRFFDSVLAKTATNSTKSRRIILLESAESMAGTFDVWWPSFVESLRKRRRSGGETLQHPTIVVFSCAPSLLAPYTVPHRDSTGSNKTSTEDAPVWWGTTEGDFDARETRIYDRLDTLANENSGVSELLPSGAKANRGHRLSMNGPRMSFLDIIASVQSKMNAVDEGTTISQLSWRVLPVIPAKRDRRREIQERVTSRLFIGVTLLEHALSQIGAVLDQVTEAFERLGREQVYHTSDDADTDFFNKDQKSLTLSSERRVARSFQRIYKRGEIINWQDSVHPWRDIQHLAAAIMGRRLSSDQQAASPMSISWNDVTDAASAEKRQSESLKQQLRQLISRKASSTRRMTDRIEGINEANQQQKDDGRDSVVAQVKKAANLSSHERRLLSCITDTSKLSHETFNDIHLPEKTIDTIRTVVSLPLLHPDSFREGVLRNHSMSGALLFGPPGTGKTLLARAVARESGARMIAIKPSDINDKYLGEGEKLVKAVFSLARRLSPCVIFIDEVEAILGARSGRDGANSGTRAHDAMLTEFMQEMDGLASAQANIDHRIVVVGATNRPFDLDEAVLRRLPRRVLVDLPGLEGRKAILDILLKNERLASDVDLQAIAQQTEGYSGSDLKQLCVSAALIAVKETVEVPWITKSPSPESAQDPQSNLPQASPQQQSSEMKDAVSPVQSRSLGTSKMSATRTLSKPRPGPRHIAVDHPSTSLLLATSGKSSDFPVMQPAFTVTDLSNDREDDINEDQDEDIDADLDDDESEDEDEDDDDEDDEIDEVHGEAQMDAVEGLGAYGRILEQAGERSESVTAKKPKRELTKRHFEQALAEIRPSSSEDGTLPELRKWAEQYGDDGTGRRKRRGYGKGFGFSEPDANKPGTERYGSVSQDG